MIEVISLNKAEQAAKEAIEKVYACIDERKNFRVEAGAGAGKTHTLITALKYLIEKRGAELLRRNQHVACITYTNVAVKEIESRTDKHPAIVSSTIHSFCWNLIENYQPFLRERIPQIDKWPEKIEEAGGISTQKVEYELGYRRIDHEFIYLNHNDVLTLAIELLKEPKFRAFLTVRYPIIFIDEYQDTNQGVAEALKCHFLETEEGPLIGLFGDHWQKIYGDGCGIIEDTNLEIIPQKSNFRSVKAVVDVLNRIRPDLPQEIVDPDAAGSVAVYHTNGWVGKRRSGGHWNDDLPESTAHEYLQVLKERLSKEGWDFSSSTNTKVLMLTHNVLAAEQGYSNIAGVFRHNEAFLKKEDPYIDFLVDTVEPVCKAYESKHFGEMFSVIGSSSFTIRSHADKVKWVLDMDKLLELRGTASIGDVIDHLKTSKRPRLSEKIERKEKDLEQATPEQIDESDSLKLLSALRKISYQEIVALTLYVNEHTPFSTKHGVKGAEFDDVLVVLGRGWNLYDFNKFLEWGGTTVPNGKESTFVRNRNLFYVVCSRARKNLVLLFTQKLSDTAISTLSRWFGDINIHSLVNGK